MANRCPICGKKPMKVTKRKLLRGHYNPVKTYRQKPNLQWAWVPAKGGSASGGNGKRMKICTDCIKTLTKITSKKKVRAVV